MKQLWPEEGCSPDGEESSGGFVKSGEVWWSPMLGTDEKGAGEAVLAGGRLAGWIIFSREENGKGGDNGFLVPVRREGKRGKWWGFDMCGA
jgi:hypothetical protein